MTHEGHHSPGFRPERIAEEIRTEVSLMLAGELKDPRLALPVIVTEVRLTPGMQTVRVFVQLEGTEEEIAKALKGLKAASGYVRHELVERLHLRRAPEVIFMMDQSEKYGEHIDELLRKAQPPEKM
jgi:ribosome-binding factor A